MLGGKAQAVNYVQPEITGAEVSNYANKSPQFVPVQTESKANLVQYKIEESNVKDILDNIKRHDTQKPDLKDIREDKGSRSYKSEQNNLERNKVIYTSKNGNVNTVIESIDGGIRQIITVQSKEKAKEYYDFPIEMEEGDKIEIDKKGQGILKDKKENVKIVILKPWAKDANGKELKTWYTIYNTSLRQYIDLSNAKFPVVADPVWCGDFFSKVEWEDRASEGGLTLRNYPTWCGRFYDIGYGFDEIMRKAPAHSAWPWYERNYIKDKGRSMYNQYRCHVWFASYYKESYNLEPSRPLVAWRTMITRNFPYACNP